MKVFTCIDHDIHWPIGGASVVVAHNEENAHALLCAVLIVKGLKPSKGFTLQELSLEFPHAVVLRDGDY